MRGIVMLGAVLLGLVGCGEATGYCTDRVGTDGQLAVNVGVSWPITPGAISFHLEGGPAAAELTVNLLRLDATVIDSYPVAGLPSLELPIVAETFSVQVMNTGAAPLANHHVIFERPCSAN
jgi:hypothetical protein